MWPPFHHGVICLEESILPEKWRAELVGATQGIRNNTIQAVSWSSVDYSVPVNLENIIVVWYFQPWKRCVTGGRWISVKLFYTPVGILGDLTQSLR